MHFFEKVWTSVTYVTSLLTLSPVKGPVTEEQSPLLVEPHVIHHADYHTAGHEDVIKLASPDVHEAAVPDVHTAAIPGPIFRPPTGRRTGPGSDFKCDYSRMVGYTYCSDPLNRDCWLVNATNSSDIYDINSNYEVRTPKGVTRRFRLDLHDDHINQDGIYFDYAKIFNGQYPGPWIQACWGDVRLGLPLCCND